MKKSFFPTNKTTMSQQQQQSQPQGNPFSEAAKGGLLLAASPLGTMMGGIALLLVVGLAIWIAVAILTDTVTAIYNMRIRMELATISVVRCLSWLSIAMAMLVASIISGFMRMFHHTVIKAISERRFSTAQSVQLLTVDAMPIMFGILYSICAMAFAERLVTSYQTLDIVDGKPIVVSTPQKAAADAREAAKYAKPLPNTQD